VKVSGILSGQPESDALESIAGRFGAEKTTERLKEQ
jgi:hypothetical protein